MQLPAYRARSFMRCSHLQRARACRGRCRLYSTTAVSTSAEAVPRVEERDTDRLHSSARVHVRHTGETYFDSRSRPETSIAEQWPMALWTAVRREEWNAALEILNKATELKDVEATA
ncbi:unnamed protein product, partial [Amoebophrya sp. A25]|eukprot:GSA25T00025338001.1